MSSSGDVHRAAAAVMLGVPEAEVTEQQRRAAKAIAIAQTYGASPAAIQDIKTAILKTTAQRRTLLDVPPDVWLSKPRRKGGQPVEVPIADLPLMQLVNIIKRLVREARGKGQLTQSPIETLAQMAEQEVPQLYALAVEANKRSLLIWPPHYHEAFIAALVVRRLGPELRRRQR